MPLSVTNYAHVRLTVSDIERSRAFYEYVFGWPVAFEVPPDADDATREQLAFLFGGVIYSFPGGIFGLRPAAPAGDRFNEDRTGLDHVCFAVADRADLVAAVEALDARGLAHEDIKDIGVGHILEFRDPDGIALELMAPPS